MTKLIFGCGYLGQRVAERWQAAGHAVSVVTRSPARAGELQARGLEPIVADVLDPETLHDLPAADTVLYAIGYDRTASRSIHDVYVDGLAQVLAALPKETGRIIYVSSTGVYGQTSGELIDETSQCQPTREGGRACLESEQLLTAHPLGNRAVVLRMAGLYGPGRVPSRDELTACQPLKTSADCCLNLIHIDDAADVVLAAEARAPLPRLYLVSDGHPVARHIYYQELARLVGAPPPRFAEPSAGNPAAGRGAGDKRIDNRRMLAELGVSLTYPTYRDGLAAVIGAEQAGK